MLKNVDWVKIALLTGMALCVLMLLRAWDDFQDERSTLADSQQTRNSGRVVQNPETLDNPFPELREADESRHYPEQDNELPGLVAADSQVPVSAPEMSGDLITVLTDVLEIQIDLRGGDLISAQLIQHRRAGNDSRPYQLLVSEIDRTYVARSGLIGTNATDTSDSRPRFSTRETFYELGEDADELVVALHYQQGLVNLTKEFHFRRQDYLIGVEYRIDNRSDNAWKAALYAQINRDDRTPVSEDVPFGVNPYVGAAITTPEEHYKKLDFKDIRDERFRATVDTGWVALLERYFLTAWIPQQGLPVFYDLRKSASRDLYYFGFTQPETHVAAGETGRISAALYVGPKDQYRLRDIAKYLDLTVDYGWLWWAAQPLYAVLFFIQSGEIHSFDLDMKLFPGFSNWGVSIILLTLVVKLLFFPLSAASYKSMARLRTLTPKMAALKERFGDDRQAMSQEMMKLYQKEKVNPMGGCLPILVQMPIFIALYWVLLESVEIRHAPFGLWIQDLSAKDPWFVLPAIMAFSMWFQQRLNPPPPDPTQARVMQMLPIIFGVMFLFFPAGLVLYWTVNNILSIAQQWAITRRIETSSAA